MKPLLVFQATQMLTNSQAEHIRNSIMEQVGDDYKIIVLDVAVSFEGELTPQLNPEPRVATNKESPGWRELLEGLKPCCSALEPEPPKNLWYETLRDQVDKAVKEERRRIEKGVNSLPVGIRMNGQPCYGHNDIVRVIYKCHS